MIKAGAGSVDTGTVSFSIERNAASPREGNISMSFVYIAELIPQAGMTDESSQTSLAKQRNTEVCTIIDVHLNDRCYKRVPSIYPLPPPRAHHPIPTP